ncbi:hypothetical protein GW17_00006867 [Ensete ventricosum]|nr:hypothetical protein GW17_00006867 [Ensete ventricosum]
MGSSKLVEKRPLPYLSPTKTSLRLGPCAYWFALVDHSRFQSRWVFILEELEDRVSRSSSSRVLLSSKGSRGLCSLWVACSLASLSSNSWHWHCLIAVRTRKAALMGVDGPSNTSGILDGIHGVQLVGRLSCPCHSPSENPNYRVSKNKKATERFMCCQKDMAAEAVVLEANSLYASRMHLVAFLLPMAEMSSRLGSSRVCKDICVAFGNRSGWCADSEGGLPGNPRLVDPLIPESDTRVLHQGLSRRCECLDSAPPTIKLVMRMDEERTVDLSADVHRRSSSGGPSKCSFSRPGPELSRMRLVGFC